MISIVVVDDQAIVRDGLVVLLQLIDGFEVLGEAADGQSGLELIARTRPNVALMDLRMPVLDGVEATAQVVSTYPSTAVLVLTTFADDESIAKALHAGARGYLTKDAGRHQLETAIRTVAAGQTALSPDVTRSLIEGLPRTPQPFSSASELGRRFPLLTPRELDVLAHMARGEANADIAASLFITNATVKSHINAIFAKLHTTTRAETIALALRRST